MTTELYDTMLKSTYHQTAIEAIKETLLDLAATAMDDPLAMEETDNDHEAQNEIALAFCDRIRHFLVEGEWPGDEAN